MFDDDGYEIQRLNMKDFRRYKSLREAQYGPFSTQKLLAFTKEFPDRIVSLYSIEFPEPQAYLMLQIREGIDELDAWDLGKTDGKGNWTAGEIFVSLDSAGC